MPQFICSVNVGLCVLRSLQVCGTPLWVIGKYDTGEAGSSRLVVFNVFICLNVISASQWFNIGICFFFF